MATIQIYGDIGENWWFEDESLTGKTIADQLASIPQGEAIQLRINSVGGSVSDGLAMYHVLKERAADITTYIDGYALSAASIVALAGSKIISPAASIWMLHNPSTIAFGTATEMRKTADVLDTHKAALMAIYCDRTGKTEAEISEVLDEETWLTGTEAIEFGLADSAEGEAKIENALPSWFRVSAKGKRKLRSVEPNLFSSNSSKATAQGKLPEDNNMPPEDKTPTKASISSNQIDSNQAATSDLTLDKTIASLQSEVKAKDEAISIKDQEIAAAHETIAALQKEKEAIEFRSTITAQWTQFKTSAESLVRDLKLSPPEFEALFDGDRATVDKLIQSPECSQHIFYMRETLATAARRSPGLPTEFIVKDELNDQSEPQEHPSVVAAREAMQNAWKS